jgi:large subunit ribosomal protein L29
VKAKEIRDLSTPELYTRLTAAEQELQNLRFQSATRQLTNYQRMGEVRRDIARIKTVIRQREMAQAS